MPNLLLVGPTNNGTTMSVEKFRRMHPAIEAANAADGVAMLPVVTVQTPAGPDEGRLFAAILYALGMPFSPRERLASKQDAAVRTMRATGARLLVIDELHNLLSGTSAQQRRLLNVLRWLGNELQIPLIGVGTSEALRAIRSDDQLANRFEPCALPLWADDHEYRRLLDTMEAVLPLRKPSGLAEPVLARKILFAAEGVLGGGDRARQPRSDPGDHLGYRGDLAAYDRRFKLHTTLRAPPCRSLNFLLLRRSPASRRKQRDCPGTSRPPTTRHWRRGSRKSARSSGSLL